MENQDHPQEFTQQPVTPVIQPQTKPATSLDAKAIFVIVFSFVLVGAIATASYVVGNSESRAREKDLQSQVTNLKNQVKSLEAANKQRISSSQQYSFGDNLSISLADRELGYLATYKQQNKQYPKIASLEMVQVATRAGFSLISSGGQPVCPRDSSIVSYTPLLNQTTGVYDSFTLRYCSDNILVTKTQADI